MLKRDLSWTYLELGVVKANGQEKNIAGMNSQEKGKIHIPVQILVHDDTRYVPFPPESDLFLPSPEISSHGESNTGPGCY